MTAAAFFKWIKEAPAAGLFVLYGEDRYFLSQAFGRLTERLNPQGSTGFSHAAFQGDGLSLPALLDALERLPVMAETFCVTLTELDPDGLSKDDWAALLAAAADLPDTTALVVTLSADVNPKRSARIGKLLTLAEEKGAVGQFPFLTDAMRAVELSRRATRLGGVLPKEAAELLVQRCPPDYGTLTLELDKLLAYAHGRTVTEADVIECTVPTAEATAFALSDALLRGQGREAYRLLSLLFAGRQSGVAVVAAVTVAFTDVYRAAAALAEGKKPDEVAAQFSYPKNRRFAVDKAFRLASRLPVGSLRQMVEVLYQTDLRLKRTNYSEQLVLEEMTARLLAIPR